MDTKDEAEKEIMNYQSKYPALNDAVDRWKKDQDIKFLSLIDKSHKINELNKKILKYDPLN
jgi:hypothetical protein